MNYAARGFFRAVIAGMMGVIAMAAMATSASAAGHPNISLTKEAPARVLYGDTAEVTLTASNPAGEPVGYNLSFRDVLPPGITYVAGSSPDWTGEPQILNDKPTAGRTTLIWSNVADLTPNSAQGFTFQVKNGPPVLEVADSYTNSAGAYLNCNERFVPDFHSDGQPVQSGGSPDCSDPSDLEESYTGWATDTATTDITAIRIRKSEPSPEAQLLRGLHDHQTVYTLTVDNNHVRASNDLRVEDFIPAGLEFLGCGKDDMADNTTDAPTNPGSSEEYPGSGPINPGNAPSAPDCVEPDVVETVSLGAGNPAGYPAGVYTHVVWNDLGNMAVSDTITIQYIAAVPIRENTMDWTTTGGAPATNGAQAANLDNNSGPETRHRQSLTNYAGATAMYQHPDGPVGVADETDHTVEAMDLRIVKSVTPDSLGAGEISTWNLNIATSEYRYQDHVEVTDTLGDGYCPLGPVNYTNNNQASDAECDPTGDNPSAPYTSATEQNDGSWIIKWDESTYPALTRIEPNQDFDLTFPSRTRVHYQENFLDAGNVSARDTAHNNVDITGESWTICAPGDPSPCAADSPDRIWNQWTSGTEIEDDSAASQSGAGPVINKQVSLDVNGPCDASTSFQDGGAPNARPGDEVCWRLTMTFPDNLISNDVKVTDFVPRDTLYVPGSTIALPTNTVGIFSSVPPEPDLIGSTALSWPLDDGGNEVNAGRVFDVVFRTKIRRSQRSSDGDLNGNLMKAVYSNSDGRTFPLRDQEDFRMEIPEISLLKGVYKVNGNPAAGNPPNTDGLWVQGGDTVTYRVDVTNDGSIDALNTEVWDKLPPEIDCTMVSNISNGGSCNSGQNRIEWSGLTVPAGDSVMLTYDVLIPEDLTGGDELINHAGVRQFESESGSGNYTSIPADNIDPTQNPNANAPSADDPSNIFIEQPIIVKNRATQVTQPGNNAADQATIGERIDYTVTVTVPEGTSLYGNDTALVDNVSSRLNLDATSVTATFDNGSGPVAIPTAGFTLSVTGNLIKINAPNPYHNPDGSGNDVIKLTFSATVRDIYPDNYAQGNSTQRVIPNVATLAWQNASGEDRTLSDSANTTLVEPNISINKSTPVTGNVSPGQDVEYSIQVSNGSGARVSTANNTTVVDTVPTGLTPVNGGTPVLDGGTVNPDGGIWDATARTITWPVISTISPGASVTLKYHVTVDLDQPGHTQLINDAVTTTTSMPGNVTGERTSTSPNNPPGYRDEDEVILTLVSPSIVKTGTPASATIGEFVTNTLTVTIPAEIDQYDVTVNDTLPDGLVFENYISATCTAGCSGGGTNINPVPLTPTGQTIGWWFGDLTSASQERTVELKYKTRIGTDYTGGDPVKNGDSLTNTANLLFNLVNKIDVPPTTPPDPDDFDESREDDSTTGVVEPNVTMEKEVTDGSGGWTHSRTTQPGDSYTYRIKVTNNGTSPAYDLVVNDEPDVELTNVVVATNTNWTVTKNWSAADRTIKWLIPGPIAPGGSVTLTYTADLVASSNLVHLQEVDNTASVPEYWGVPEEDRDDPDKFREYEDGEDSVKLTVLIPKLELDKTTGLSGNPDTGNATVNQAFPWRIVITNPNVGSLLKGVDLTDTLPPNWTYVPNSAQITGSGTLTPGGQIEPTITTHATGDVLKWTDIANLVGNTENVVASFNARPNAQAVLNPGLAPEAHVNDAVGTGEDSSGATGSKDGPYTDEDDATATLLKPVVDLQLTKDAVDPDEATAGLNQVWTIKVKNAGPNASPTVKVTDVLPAGLTYVNATSSQGTCAEAPAGTVTCDIGWMDPDDEVTITLTTKIGADQAGNTLVNPASVDDPNIDDPTPENNSDEDEVTPKEIPADITKTSTPDEATIGEFVTNTLTVTIPAEIVQYDATVIDNLPDGLLFENYISATCTAGCGVSSDPEFIDPVTLTPSGQTIGWWFGDLTAADQDRTVVLKYRTRIAGTYSGGEDVTAGDTLVNEASLLFNLVNKIDVPPTTPPDPEDFDEQRTDDSTTEVVEPLVTMTKAVDDGDGGWTDERLVQPGESFTYRIQVTNEGTSPAYDVVVTDEPDVELTNVDVATNAAWTVTKHWSAADRTIKWLIPGPIGVGETVTLTYTADLVGSAELVNLQQVNNTAAVPEYWGVPEEDRDDPEKFREYEDGEDSVELTVLLPRLELDKTTGLEDNPDTGEARVGEAYPWRIVITNPNVGSLLKGVDLTDTLPANWTYVPNSAQITGSGTLTPGGQIEPTVTPNATGDVLKWTDIADLVGSDENVIVEFQAKPGDRAVLNPGLDPEAHVNDAVGTGEDTSGASGSKDGPYRDDDDATATLLKPEVDLLINKVADKPADATAGKDQSWTLTVKNNGPHASPTVKVTDVLPAGLTYVNATSSQGTCAENPAGTVTCDIGWMDPDDVVTITLTTKIGADQAGNTLVNPAEVDDPNVEDTNPDNNHDEDEVKPGSVVDLGVTKRTVSPKIVRPGSKVTYQVVVTNHGPSDATGVTLSDQLPEGLGGVTTNHEGCSVTGGEISCALGDLAAGNSITIKVTGKVKDGHRKLVNRVLVKGNEPDPNPENDRDKVTDPVRIPKLQLRKKADRRKVDAGRVITYTISFRNKVRNSVAKNVLICDNLPRYTTVAGKGGGFMRDGNVCWKVKSLKFSRKFKTRTLKLRVDRDAPRTTVVNNVWIGKKKASAKVHVVPGSPKVTHAGGVTG